MVILNQNRLPYNRECFWLPSDSENFVIFQNHDDPNCVAGSDVIKSLIPILDDTKQHLQSFSEFMLCLQSDKKYVSVIKNNLSAFLNIILFLQKCREFDVYVYQFGTNPELWNKIPKF